MQGFLRFVQLLTIAMWVGGIVFFAFVLAPTAFSALPTVRLAGLVVGQSLRAFDVLALGSGILFLLATAAMFRLASARVRGRYEMEILLAGIMFLATAYIHFNLLPSMDADQAAAQSQLHTDIAATPAGFSPHIHFDRLHKRSETVEGATLLLGLIVLFLMSREQMKVD